MFQANAFQQDAFQIGLSASGGGGGSSETVIEDFVDLSDWTSLLGTVVATGGQGAGSGATDNFAYTNASSYGPDGFFGITIVTPPADNEYVFLCMRIVNVPTPNGYFVSLVKSSGTDTMYIRRIDTGVSMTLGSWPQEVAAGGRIGIDCTGSTISAYVDTGSGWTLVGSVTDATYNSAGRLALDIYNTAARVDNLVQVTLGAAVVEQTGYLAPMGIIW